MIGRTDGRIASLRPRVIVFMATVTVSLTCSELTTLSLALERGSKPFLYLVILIKTKLSPKSFSGGDATIARSRGGRREKGRRAMGLTN
jgi:hypothetical protein